MGVLAVFGKNVRAYRKRAGLSQEKLGQMSGLHRTYIGGIEQGRRNASLENVAKIASALGLSPMRLLLEFDENGRPVFESWGDQVEESDLGEGVSVLANCAIATWNNGVLDIVPIKADEIDLSVQTLGNLFRLGYRDLDLIRKYNEIWPQIKGLYGA